MRSNRYRTGSAIVQTKFERFVRSVNLFGIRRRERHRRFDGSVVEFDVERAQAGIVGVSSEGEKDRYEQECRSPDRREGVVATDVRRWIPVALSTPPPHVGSYLQRPRLGGAAPEDPARA